MVPTTFHYRDALPLTANSKIDKKALTALAAELDVVADEEVEPPATPTEQRLAQVWATVLGEPVEQVGRRDHFFDKGGTSLTAVKVVIGLKREVSLKDITRLPVLADLAALIDGRAERQTGLLQVLAEPPAAEAALVCFPYAGGNAVNFRPMADALAGLAVFAVELPGHDLAAEREPFATIGETVARVVAELDTELAKRGLTRVMLWGHSAGTALAVATARALHERGVEVARLFLAAQLPRDAPGAAPRPTASSAQGDAEIAAGLAGYGEFAPQQAEHVGAAYRHDCVAAHRYFADLLDAAPAPLPVPVTVVLAADDPSTAGSDHTTSGRWWPSTSISNCSPTGVTTSCAPGRTPRPRWSTAQRDCSPAADTQRQHERYLHHVPIDDRPAAARADGPRQAAAAGRAGRRPGRRLDRRPPGRVAPSGAEPRRAPGPRARAAQPRRGR